MKVIFLGTNGLYSMRSYEAIAKEHNVAVVGIAERQNPGSSWKTTARNTVRKLGLGPQGLTEVAQRRGSKVVGLKSATDGILAEALRASRPDVICIAGFPWIVPRDIFNVPPYGAVNAHSSLLPRHRGIFPLFWIYYHGDKESGVTIHRVDDGPDTGDILLQSRFSVARGLPVDTLNEMNAAEATKLLPEVLALLEDSEAKPQTQEMGLATEAPRIVRGTRYAKFDEWTAEQSWHFLVGLQRRYHEPIVDEAQRGVSYSEVKAFSNGAHGFTPGTIKREGASCKVYCRDGFVELKCDT